MFGRDVYTEWEVPVTRYLRKPRDKCHYEYDFGDGWVHRVLLEQVKAAHAGTKYPICTGGRRAGPVEDCGGVPGYYRLLEALADPDHAEHGEMVEWIGGGEYHPDRFRIDEVAFSNPELRLKALKEVFD